MPFIKKVPTFTQAPLEHEIFKESTFGSLYKDLDEQKKLDRQTFWATAAILAVMCPIVAWGVYAWVASLPLPH